MEKAEKIRSFIAVTLSDKVIERIEKFQKELQTSQEFQDVRIKWVNSVAMHVTLKFLDNIKIDIIPDIRNIMLDVAKKQAPFPVSIQGFGVFPRPDKPRIIWVGITEGISEFRLLREELENSLESLDFAKENGKYKPHITLARARGRQNDITSLIEKYKDIELGQCKVDSMILFKSDLKPTGAVYTALETVKLGPLD